MSNSQNEKECGMEFEKMMMAMKPSHQKKIAVAAAQDPEVLKALVRARDLEFATAILCGDAAQIRANANSQNIDISKFEIIDEPDIKKSADVAVALVRSGAADILMKGLIKTADLLRAVVNRDTGIRGDDDVISHVAVLYSEKHNKTFILTDVGMVMYPDLNTKVHLINNAVKFAKKIGIENPKVAPLCAVEVLNPKMPATVDAAELEQMNARGEIAGCAVSGPLAFDVAVSVDAAKIKDVKSPVAGNADILLFHNIEAGNSTLKAMTQFGGFIFGGILMGARAPIIVNSRSDDETSKLFSIACACAL